MEITLDIRETVGMEGLRQNYIAANDARLRMDDCELMNIRLMFDDGPPLFVQAKGKPLYVESYGRNECERINFGTSDDLRYHDKDPKIPLNRYTVLSLLNHLRCLEEPRDFRVTGNGRAALLLVIFLTSEIVRNELLCELFLGIREQKNEGLLLKWNDCKLLYTNWNKMSRMFYGGLNYQRIMVQSCVNAVQQSMGEGDENLRAGLLEALKTLNTM